MKRNLNFNFEEDLMEVAEECRLEKEMKDNVSDSDPESFQSCEEEQVFEKFLRQKGAPNDYILVMFETEKKPVFYIAQILVVHEEEYYVSFMRKTTGNINNVTFSFPKEVDTAFTRKKDAILVLPPPTSSGTKCQCPNKVRVANMTHDHNDTSRAMG